MPFVSRKQRAWMHVNDPEMARKWEKETPKGKKLPERVKQAEPPPPKGVDLETWDKVLQGIIPWSKLKQKKTAGVVVAPSNIAGQGLTAETAYVQGDPIGPALDLVPTGQGDLAPELLQTALARYVNHAENANTTLYRMNPKQWGLRASTNIPPGTELTYDYREAQSLFPHANVWDPDSVLDQIKQSAYSLGISQVNKLFTP